MAWNYSGDPAASDLDATRFLIQDVDTTDQQFADAEINYALAQYGAPISTAAALCDQLAAKYARKVDKAVGDLRISYGQRYQHYVDLASRLRAQAVTNGLTVYSGGTSVADMETVEQNDDRVAPPFKIGQMDNPTPPSESDAVLDNQFTVP